MLRLLLTRRWLSLLGVVIVLVPTFVALGFWQLDRLDQRRGRNASLVRNIDTEPAPIETLLSPPQTRPVDRTIEWRQVQVTGRYDGARSVLVRNRTAVDDGPPGFHVLVPLVTEGGPALLIDRGWIPYGENASETPAAPAPPPGEVSVIARLRPSEEGGLGGGLPTGQIARIDVAALGSDLPYDLYGGFAELVREEPAPATAPTLLDTPEPSDGPHLSYAVQWFLFAAIAVGGFCYLLIRESHEPPPPAEPQTPLIPHQQAHT